MVQKSNWKNDISYVIKIINIIPDDGGTTHLWNVGRQSFTRQYIPEDNSEHNKH
jgi:hypothetical protein